MIIVKLIGGLGNQMFQYAYAKNVALKTGLEVKLDTLAYTKKDYLAIQDDTKRNFILDKFATTLPLATESEVRTFNPLWRKVVRKIMNKIRLVNNYQYRSKETTPRDGSYLSGFWQNENYFIENADAVRSDLRLKHPFAPAAALVHEQIGTRNNSVSLHIRRGDYVTNAAASKFFGSLSIEYYKQALEYVAQKIGSDFTVFIFSDDIEWVRQTSSQFVPQSADTVYVSDRNKITDHEELALMSACKHHVIANSSFSWWGAWLNPSQDKIVVAPKQWLTDPSIDTSEVTPKSWVRM